MGQGIERSAIKIKFNANICCVLLAMILSMNGIRYLLNIQESNALIYGVYVVFIVLGYFKYYSRITNKYSKNNIYLIIFTVFIVIYSLVTAIFGGKEAIFEAIKLIIIAFIIFIVYFMTTEDLRETLNYTYAFILCYVFVLLLKPNRINTYLSKGSTYLNLALPIGLVLTMLLIRIVLRFYNKDKVLQIISECTAGVLCFVALTKLSGRGSIIFPLVITVLFVFILGRKHIFKMVFMLFLVLLTATIAYKFFLRTADSYIINRFVRLFNDMGSEDRWDIWKGYIVYSLKHNWFIFGGGTGAAVREYRFYPHNLYLHMAGEFGIIGIISSIYYTIYSIKNTLWGFNNIRIKDRKNALLFYELSAGVTYMFLNFMKSFSLYDCCPLLVLIIALISFTNNYKMEKCNGELPC